MDVASRNGIRTRLATTILAVGMALAASDAPRACTAFCAADGTQVLIGNNEDWHNPRTKLWFVPGGAGSFGRMYVGFDDLHPQGGMNERGLWFDGFAAPPVKATGSAGLPAFPGSILDRAMSTCTTVDDVVRLFSQYNRSFLTEAILMFADASGDAVAIEPDAIVRKTGPFFVQTNFHQSRPPRDGADDRYRVASRMLERADGGISPDLFRRILAATHQRGGAPTLYSNIYDLRARTMRLFYFHDFEHSVTFRLDEELTKGARVLDIPALFAPNPAAERFAATRSQPAAPNGIAWVTAAVMIPLALAAAVVVTWIRAERPLRLALAGVVACVPVAALLGLAALRVHPSASGEWTEFAIGPASGASFSLQPSAVRSTGLTLKAAVGFAHDVPPVRVVGPAWLDDARYSIKAVVPPEAAESLRSRFLDELKARLHLEAHLDIRPVEAYVLAVSGTPHLERARLERFSAWLSEGDARLQSASMDNVAEVLQRIVGKPVIDETGLTGLFDLEFEWGADRAASVRTVLQDRFGLTLQPATRQLEVLVIDRIRRDPALVLLGEIGRLTRGAPPGIRNTVAEFLTVR